MSTIIINIPNYIGWIILILLALDGLRNFIAHLNWIPRDWKISNFFYGKRDKRIIQEALIDLGYTKVDNIVKGMSKRELLDLKLLPPTNCYRKLLKVIRECMINTQKELQYRSGDKNVSTSYYIHTMMASQDNHMIEDMSELFIYLINSIICQKKLDFIIVPKNGNPLLGNFVSKSMGARCILYKDKVDSSRANDPQVAVGGCNSELDLEINFEGAHYLNKNQKLKGMVLDCNISSGDNLIEIANAFNRAITQTKANIDKIVDIFTLFIADDTHKDIDKKFKNHNFKLHRFFDLNENLKQDIFKVNPEDIDCHSDSCPCVDEIIEKMKTSSLLKYSKPAQKEKWFGS
jgi:hypothetical protein